MPTLTITSRGQITLGRELLQHLGAKPGQRLEVDTLPGRQIRLHVAPLTRDIQDFIGLLKGRTDRTATLGEIGVAIETGWADRL